MVSARIRSGPSIGRIAGTSPRSRPGRSTDSTSRTWSTMSRPYRGESVMGMRGCADAGQQETQPLKEAEEEDEAAQPAATRLSSAMNHFMLSPDIPWDHH